MDDRTLPEDVQKALRAQLRRFIFCMLILMKELVLFVRKVLGCYFSLFLETNDLIVPRIEKNAEFGFILHELQLRYRCFFSVSF